MNSLTICFFVVIAVTLSQAKIDRDNAFHMEHYHPKSPGYLPPGLLHPRVVGGQEAAKNQFPYQVGLYVDLGYGTAFCGATLISKKFAMTAAHCASGAYGFELVLGAHTIGAPEAGSITVTSSKAKVHPNYDPYNIENDIAIIELDEEVPLNEQINIVPLPKRSDASNQFAGEQGTLSGWGKTSDSGSISPVLRFMSNPILTNSECSANMAGLNIPSTQICSSGEGLKGACNGDSGGPLVVYENGKPKQVGIVSYGLIYGCVKGYASAYTRVTSFLDFIEENSDVIIQ
ncbi:brachyurin-like [Chrysoperla carnea]|uniref:brachyurin-like n=1 Tax=Chrysoperla carnea TaxID=189513 RepID=UPI001D07FD3B|nr:brachyurin-like [Chrysoperla carnea]